MIKVYIVTMKCVQLPLSMGACAGGRPPASSSESEAGFQVSHEYEPGYKRMSRCHVFHTDMFGAFLERVIFLKASWSV